MRIAIIGATGEVGRMMITCLEEFRVEVASLDLFASGRSEGTTVYFNESALKVQKLADNSLCRKYDYILLSAGGAVSKRFAPIAAEAGNTVIDNSSAWRREELIPLVVPEINGELLAGYSGIIANPNCSTIQMVLALHPLHLQYRLNKVVVSTYQSVSGSGHTGIDLLEKQRAGSTEKGIYPELIDLNVIPQIGAFLDDGYCQEEDKMHFETARILNIPALKVCATTVRVPVMYGHAESVYAEFDRAVDLTEAAKLLKKSPVVKYHDNIYMTPLEIGKSNDSHVSRMRYGVDKNSLTFWNVGNNVRLGAAANAVRILIKHKELNG
jgi:aspartate-semialdehyde dehydrogenase